MNPSDPGRSNDEESSEHLSDPGRVGGLRWLRAPQIFTERTPGCPR